ncbi:MAG: SDR family NAD(P)-dependent oxidoreductase [bacterium]|jgi:UDP-glucuronate 4-epimerase|nr:SDR family NAD(P)-dependent oxidoreductase [bacterium]
MRNKRILVTGGAGFIGSHLCEALLKNGWRVFALDCFDPYYPRKLKEQNIAGLISNDHFSLLEVDIRDDNSLQEALEEIKPPCVVHLAARGGVRPSLEIPKLYEEINIRGTLNVLEAARATGVRRFVYASSSSVYGVNDNVPFKEDETSLRVVSPYAATKVAGEALCRVYHRLADFNSTVCLRFFTVYGPRQRPDMAIRKFAGFIHEGKEIPIFGDGSSYRDYTFISDIIQGILGAVEQGSDFEIINLGESKTIKLLDLIGLLEQALGKKAILEHLPPQLGDVPRTFACVDKARKLLGYNPQVGIEEGINRFAKWFLEQQ